MLRLKERTERLVDPATGERTIAMYPDWRQLHMREEDDSKWHRIAWVILDGELASIRFLRFFNEEQKASIQAWVQDQLGMSANTCMPPDPDSLPNDVREDVYDVDVDDAGD